MKSLYLLEAVLLSFVVAACGGTASTPTAAPASLTPVVRVVPPREAPARPRREPVATVAPAQQLPASPEEIRAFAEAHRQINIEWDQFRADFDQWRDGLIACDAIAVQAALRRFAGLATDTTTDARALPRPPAVRELARELIRAAEGEERAFRQLRDTWAPDSEEVFQDVAEERSKAASVQNEVADALFDLIRRTSPSSRNSVLSFSAAFDEANSEWDEFHRDYNRFRAEEVDLTSSELVSSLSGLVDEFSAVTTKVRSLPHSTSTAPIARIILEAADEEELALRNLRNSFDKSEAEEAEGPAAEADDIGLPPSPPEVAGESEAGAPPGATADGEEGPSFSPRDPELFQVFGAQLVGSNTKRREAVEKLAELLGDISEEDRSEVEEFSEQYQSLAASWADFHEEYDDWRRTEGGCDRSKAREALGRFATDFSALARRIRALPGVTSVPSLGEIFVEAAEREEEALSDLRDTWRPFDADVYSKLEVERNTAERLRRRVDSSLNNLLYDYGITLVRP